jgi:hypothetical protein
MADADCSTDDEVLTQPILQAVAELEVHLIQYFASLLNDKVQLD